MPVRIVGIGSILSCGNGVVALINALMKGKTVNNHSVSMEGFEEYVSPRMSRRMDHLTRMVLFSSHLALKNAGIEKEELGENETGIVFGTALGPQSSTFSFLDGLIDDGDSCVSSYSFTNSIHSTVAAQVSLNLGIRGPLRTITAFSFTAGAAIETAISWISNSQVKRVLLILGEETSRVLTYSREKMGGQGPLRPFSKDCSYISGEGCIVFVLENCKNGYCSIISHEVGLSGDEAASLAATCDMLFCAAAGKADEFKLYQQMWSRARLVGAYSSLYGSFYTGMAVELAIAALSLFNNCVYPIPGVKKIKSIGINLPEEKEYNLKKVAVTAVCSPKRLTYTELEC